MDGKNPCEVIQACGANINEGHDLFAHAMLQRMLIDSGMHAGKSFGHVDPKILCQRHTYHAITGIDLMTQANRLDRAVAIDRVANADHRIGEINEPCIGTSLLHMMRNMHDGTDVAGSMGEATRSAVFGIRLPHTIFDWDLKIAF